MPANRDWLSGRQRIASRDATIRGEIPKQRNPRRAKARYVRAFGINLSLLNNKLDLLAEWTGLEPATPGVTGRYSNQLNYHSADQPISLMHTPVRPRHY